MAAQNGKLEVCNTLLKLKADANAVDEVRNNVKGFDTTETENKHLNKLKKKTKILLIILYFETNSFRKWNQHFKYKINIQVIQFYMRIKKNVFVSTEIKV